MRYRFVDRILANDARGTGTLRVCKVFPRSEDYFDGTFRAEGEVPSSLVLEAMATAGSLVLAIRSDFAAHGVLLKVNRAAFAGAAHAGDRLVVDARLRGLQEAGGETVGVGMAQVVMEGRVEESLIAEADLLFLSIPMAWSFGPECEREVSALLELIGAADDRP